MSTARTTTARSSHHPKTFRAPAVASKKLKPAAKSPTTSAVSPECIKVLGLHDSATSDFIDFVADTRASVDEHVALTWRSNEKVIRPATVRFVGARRFHVVTVDFDDNPEWTPLHVLDTPPTPNGQTYCNYSRSYPTTRAEAIKEAAEYNSGQRTRRAFDDWAIVIESGEIDGGEITVEGNFHHGDIGCEMVISYRAMRIVRATSDERKHWNRAPITKACPEAGDPRGWRVYLVNVSKRRYWFSFKSQATSEADAKRKAAAVLKKRDKADPDFSEAVAIVPPGPLPNYREMIRLAGLEERFDAGSDGE